MELKKGVKLAGLRPQIVVALLVAEALWREYKTALVVTSGSDGKHKVGSKHYSGDAVDLRVWNLPGYDATDTSGSVKQIAAELGRRLGDEFDVVYEGDHLHVEYDP